MIKKMFFMAAIFGAVFFFTVSARAGSGIAFWSMFVGSSWVYNGSSVSDTWTYRAEVTNKDTTTIPGVETYVVYGSEEGTPFDRQWISINSSEMRQWRYDSWGEQFNTVIIDGGSVLAKNPVYVGDHWNETTTGTFNGSPVTIYVTTTVESIDIVTVPLGTFEAYKIRREITIPGVLIYTLTEYRWFVPYIGFIKTELQEPEEETETNVLASMVLNGFTDVPFSFWAYYYIMAIYDAGITTGYGDGRYGPLDFVYREQMAAFLVRGVEGEPALDYCDSGSLFPDVTPDMWSCRYIKRLKELGITTGYGDGRYGPYDLVLREQMAAFLVRAVEGEPPDNYCDSGSTFNDVTPDMWSCKYIKRLKELGITTGYAGGTIYGPYDFVTRDQMAAFLARAFLGWE